MSEGRFTLADGRTVSAGRTQIDDTPSRIAADLAPSAVLGQVTSVAEDSPVVSRIFDVDGTGFSAKLQEAEAADGRHLPETFDWIAIEAGAGPLSADLLTDITSRPHPIPARDVVLGALQTMNGTDPAGLRYRETEAGTDLRIREEQSLDAERGHMAETVGLVLADPGYVVLS